MRLKLILLIFLLLGLGTCLHGQVSRSRNFTDVQCKVYSIDNINLKNAISSVVSELNKEPIGNDYFIVAESASVADSISLNGVKIGLANLSIYTYHPTWYDSLQERLTFDMVGAFKIGERVCLIFGENTLMYFTETDDVETVRYCTDYFACYCAEFYRYIYVDDNDVIIYTDDYGVEHTWPYPFQRAHL